MRTLKTLPAGLMLLFSLNLLNGCLMFKPASYKEGLQYLNAQAYDQAVESLTLATIEDPQDPKIAADLQRAKQLSANYNFKLGEKLSAQNELSDALVKFEKAKMYQPDNITYANRLKKEKQKYDRIAGQIRMAVENAADPAQWDLSLKVLEELRRYESSFPDLSGNIELIKKKASVHYESRSDQALGQGRVEDAYQAITKAASYSEDENLVRKKQARQHLQQSNRYWRDKQYAAAYDEIIKAVDLEQGQPAIEKYRDNFSSEWAGILYNEAVSANNDGDYTTAKAKLKHLSSFKPGFLNTEEMLNEISLTLASTYYEKAENILNDQDRTRVGTALIYYLLVRQENAGLYPDIEDKITQAKKLLGKELEQRISIQFDNKSEEPGAGNLVREQLLSRIKNSEQLKHITILDRESIDDILREQGLGQGFLDESTAITVKKIKGIQSGVRGEVIRLSVRETGRDRPSYGSARYKSGTRWIPNPDYTAAQGEIQIAQQGVLQAQRELNNTVQQQKQIARQTQSVAAGKNQNLVGMSASLGQLAISMAEGKVAQANNQLANAQTRLARTPQMIEEDIYSDYRYEIFDLSLQGEVVLSFKTINFTTSEIGEVHTVRKEIHLNDRYIPGDPGKNVQSDPINFPPKDELKNHLLKQAVDELFEKMVVELSRASQNYYMLAKRAEKNEIADEAIENYLRYMYSAPDPNDQRVREANQYIDDHFGLRILREKGE